MKVVQGDMGVASDNVTQIVMVVPHHLVHKKKLKCPLCVKSFSFVLNLNRYIKLKGDHSYSAKCF